MPEFVRTQLANGVEPPPTPPAWMPSRLLGIGAFMAAFDAFQPTSMCSDDLIDPCTSLSAGGARFASHQQITVGVQSIKSAWLVFGVEAASGEADLIVSV